MFFFRMLNDDAQERFVVILFRVMGPILPCLHAFFTAHVWIAGRFADVAVWFEGQMKDRLSDVEASTEAYKRMNALPH